MAPILDRITEMLRSKDSWSIADAARYDRLVTTFGESTGATSDVSGLRMPGSERCSTPVGLTGGCWARSWSGEGATPPESEEPH
jgi:hypothetical protein